MLTNFRKKKRLDGAFDHVMFTHVEWRTIGFSDSSDSSDGNYYY